VEDVCDGWAAQWWLVIDKVNVADPELTTRSGLYVYLWICGVDIKAYFISQFCLQLL